MKKKDVKLYNLLLPVWLILLFPQLWLVVLPANFLIDLLVLRLTMKHLHLENRKELCRQSIGKVWLMGFVSDFAGAFFMILWNILDVTGADFVNAVNFNPFERLDAFLWVTGCVVLTGVILYFVNRKFCLKNLPVTEAQRRSLALSLAVFTAPYLFYLPTAWFW